MQSTPRLSRLTHRRRLRKLLTDHGAPDPARRGGRVRRPPLDPRRLAAGERAALEAAIAAELASLANGRRVILYTALGPETDLGGAIADGRQAIGAALGRLQRALVERAGLRRVVIAGGDTSSHALRQLGIYALTLRLPLPSMPGPLCQAHSDDPRFDGLEIGLKGGQAGADDYFASVRSGAACAAFSSRIGRNRRLLRERDGA